MSVKGQPAKVVKCTSRMLHRDVIDASHMDTIPEYNEMSRDPLLTQDCRWKLAYTQI